MGLIIGVGNTKPTFPYDYYYGIEWDTTVSNPKLTRVGKTELHQTLPIQSRMRRCLLNDDGSVNYYLHANNSALRDNGAAAKLDGTDGQVMVELPEMYVRFEMEGTKRRCLMSAQALPGFTKWAKSYISAYEATSDRTVLAKPKLASVVNKTAAFRGGNNNAAWDGTSRDLLGLPATAISLTNFRAYARNRGSVSWNCNTYQIQRQLWWLFAVEYATFNCQLEYNAQTDANGCKQGGLGAGVTTLNQDLWSSFNSYYPFVSCGYTNLTDPSLSICIDVKE